MRSAVRSNTVVRTPTTSTLCTREWISIVIVLPTEEQGPERPYILFVGALEPRKDVPTLIDAHARLADRLPHDLVLCGLPAWGVEQIEEAIAKAPDSSRILRTGYVSDDEKIDLYRGASVFVYPSIAEGFGLPVLEAMACGTPVVTTTGSAPEEVVGDAAVLVPPQDPTALADAIARVLEDAEARIRPSSPGSGTRGVVHLDANRRTDNRRLATSGRGAMSSAYRTRVDQLQRRDGPSWTACARSATQSFRRSSWSTTLLRTAAPMS